MGHSCAAAMQPLLLLALAAVLPIALGHGLLVKPQSRNYNYYLNSGMGYTGADGCNAGGKVAVSLQNTLTWPDGRHLLCGEPYGTQNPLYQTPGPIADSYWAGQVIHTEFVYKVGHYGAVQMRVCPLNAESDSQCTPLERADGKGTFWYIPEQQNFNWGGAQGSQTWPLVNYDPRYGWYSWRLFDKQFCGIGKWCGAYYQDVTFATSWVLPKDTPKGHSILQWYYVTGHNCWPKCNKSDPSYPNCQPPANEGPRQECGTAGSTYPEEFWNCADIEVK